MFMMIWFYCPLLLPLRMLPYLSSEGAPDLADGPTCIKPKDGGVWNLWFAEGH